MWTNTLARTVARRTLGGACWRYSAVACGIKLADPALLRSTAYVDGEFIPSSQKSTTLVVENPFDCSVVGEISCVDNHVVDHALESSSRAFEQWRKQPLSIRTAALDALDQQLVNNADDLATIITAENGKPHREALAEVEYACGYIRSLRNALLNHGTRTSTYDAATLSYTVREPVGIVLAVTPWNFPLAMLTRKLAPALVAGCSIVAKPSEETPLTALALGELCSRAAIPPGVFSVLPTLESTEVCARIAAHRDVRMIAFTGSTRVGSALSQLAAKRLQRTSMELGGLAPMIVAHDADIEKAVAGAMTNKFRNAGQSCVSINRVYCHEDVVDEFVMSMSKQMASYSVLGNGFNKSTTVGPLINGAAVARVQAMIQDALEHGARIAYSAEMPDIDEKKSFCAPTLLADVSGDAKVMNEEIFGPVLAVRTFSDYPSMLKEANATEMGLAGYVFSESLETSHSLIRELQVGMVAANTVALSNWRTSFGGVKQSGSGREGGGESALDDYTDEKFVLLRYG